MHFPAAVPPARPRKVAPEGLEPTIKDWLSIPEEKRAELIDGRIVYQAMPGPAHGMTQGEVFAFAQARYGHRPGGADRPGGWWISMEVDMQIAGMGCRPDVLGWRREKHTAIPETDEQGVVTAVPDWICEVLSPSTAHVDRGAKRIGYHRAGVTHYWLVDPDSKSLTVLRWTAEGYLVEFTAGPRDKVRAEPFAAAEIDVAVLFGEEERGTPESTRLTLRVAEEKGGRWVGTVDELPDSPEQHGVLVQGVTAGDARSMAKVLALRILAERVDKGEAAPGTLDRISFTDAGP